MVICQIQRPVPAVFGNSDQSKLKPYASAKSGYYRRASPDPVSKLAQLRAQGLVIWLHAALDRGDSEEGEKKREIYDESN